MPMPRACWIWSWLTLAPLPLVAQQPEVAGSLGFEAGAPGSLPQPWFVPSAAGGWRAELVAGDAAVGERRLELRPSDADAAAIGNVMASSPAGDRAGKRVRLRASLRVAGDGHAQMWLRVDCPDRQRGAFDNMQDRPVRGSQWSEAVIELDVAADATKLAFGVLAFGGAAVSIDDVSLTVVGDATPTQPADAAAPLTERERANAIAASRLLGYLWFFHPSDALVGMASWHHLAVDLLDAALPATDDHDLCRRLRAVTAPIAPTVQLWRSDEVRSPPLLPNGATGWRHWQHTGAGRIASRGNVYHSRTIDVPRLGEAPPPVCADLLTGTQCDDIGLARLPWHGTAVIALVPVSVATAGEHGLPAAAVPADWRARWRAELGLHNRTTRLAAVAEAWNVFQHFYPYFDVVEADWAAELPRALTAAATAADEAAMVVVLERLVAALHDGHGHVVGGTAARDGLLPVAVRWVEGRLVVTGIAADVHGVQLGDVVQAIDGRPVVELHAAMAARISAATEGWARTRSAQLFASWPTADPVRLTLQRADGSVAEVAAARSPELVQDRADRRPANGEQLAEGIVYFDLDGATDAELATHLEALRRARAIVFDLRGYPDSAATGVLEMLLTAPGQSARWGIPVVTRPDRRDWQWNESGRWQLVPKEHLAAEIAFLTDGRAISYAESVMGIVEAYRLGEIVGATTAGTNGNVNPFEVAGGLRIAWTGMRVLKHDGGAHHGVGIAPSVPVAPTIAGIAAGRDEVLERAIEVLQGKLAR